MIVCLEGIDACGKATHAKLLARRLDARVISFPDYESLSGRLIRQHLQREWVAMYDTDPIRDRSQDGRLLDAMAFQSLMLTNRMELAPDIHRSRIYNRHLVLDRYWPSGVVYGGADGIDVEWLLQIHKYLPQATHYVLLDIEPRVSAERRPERRDRYELQPGLMEDVASRYRELWNEMKRVHMSRWYLLDANESIQDVQDALQEAIGV
jgi:dTMP kinase